MWQVGSTGGARLLLCWSALHDAMAPRHLHTCSHQTTCPHICPPTHLPTASQKFCQTQRNPPWHGGRNPSFFAHRWRWRLWAACCWWRSPHSPALHSPLVTEQLRHWRRLQPCGGGSMHTSQTHPSTDDKTFCQHFTTGKSEYGDIRGNHIMFIFIPQDCCVEEGMHTTAPVKSFEDGCVLSFTSFALTKVFFAGAFTNPLP